MMKKMKNKANLILIRRGLLNEARDQREKIKTEFTHILESAKSQGRKISLVGLGAFALYIFVQMLLSRSRTSSIQKLLKAKKGQSSEAVVIKESTFSPLFESIRSNIAQFILNLAQKELASFLKRYADRWERKSSEAS